MWWEIIPSFTIITVVGFIPALASRAINRALHDGNPVRRDYTMNEKHGVLYHFRDVQHSQPSFWQKYVKVGKTLEVNQMSSFTQFITSFQSDAQGNGTVYKSNTLDALN